MPKLKFLNANGDFVLTDADQSRRRPISRLPTRAASSAALHRGWQATARQGRILFCWLRAASRLCTKAVRRAISGCNLPTERCGAPPGQSAAQQAARFGKGADEVMAVRAGFWWQTVERAQSCAWRKSRRDLVCARRAGHGGADACHRDKPWRRSAYLYPHGGNAVVWAQRDNHPRPPCDKPLAASARGTKRRDADSHPDL